MQPLSKAKLKLFSSLHLKKYREEEGLFIIEGRKMLAEALIQGLKPEAILLCNPPGTMQVPGVEKNRVFSVSEEEFSKLTSQVNPEGVLAVLPWPAQDKYEFLPSSAPLPELSEGPGFLLEDIRDPGNLGTLIRIADWFGFKEIFCSAETADCFNPKVLRSSMGSIFRVKIIYVSDFIPFVAKNIAHIRIADMEGQNAREADFSKRKWILLGNEASGVSAALRSLPGAEFISIPGSGNAESLNVSVAGGILAWAAAR